MLSYEILGSERIKRSYISLEIFLMVLVNHFLFRFNGHGIFSYSCRFLSAVAVLWRFGVDYTHWKETIIRYPNKRLCLK